MAERILTLRELNRAILARQFLLQRVKATPLDVIKQLVAIQGQVPNAPYIGLWSRLHSFQRADLTSLLESRQVVRATSLRNTLHLLKTEDYLLMHPLLQHTLSRNLRLFAQKAEGFDMDRFVTEMLIYVQEQPRTGVELRAKMEEFFPGMGLQQVADAVRMRLALIQPPPAGTWNFTGQPTHTEALAWLGRPWASEEEGLPQLILRYLAAFGPARAQDIQKWSGISKLQPAIEILRPKLLTFRDEQGKELFDLPHAPRPEADTPAPVRFLAAFDNLLLSYIERERMIAEAYFPLVFTNNGFQMATILVDGFVRGLWKIERQSTATTLVIKVFEPLSPSAQNTLLEESEQLMRWMNGDAMPYNIQLIISQ